MEWGNHDMKRFIMMLAVVLMVNTQYVMNGVLYVDYTLNGELYTGVTYDDMFDNLNSTLELDYDNGVKSK